MASSANNANRFTILEVSEGSPYESTTCLSPLTALSPLSVTRLIAFMGSILPIRANRKMLFNSCAVGDWLNVIGGGDCACRMAILANSITTMTMRFMGTSYDDL